MANVPYKICAAGMSDLERTCILPAHNCFKHAQHTAPSHVGCVLHYQLIVHVFRSICPLLCCFLPEALHAFSNALQLFVRGAVVSTTVVAHTTHPQQVLSGVGQSVHCSSRPHAEQQPTTVLQ